MRRAGLTGLLAVLVVLLWPAAPASAHPLGNFTINTADRVVVEASGTHLTHLVDLAEFPTFALRQASRGVDTDRNGLVSDSELTAYAGRECLRIAGLIDLQVDGGRRQLQLSSALGRSAPGTGGLTTSRLECEFGAGSRPQETITLKDGNAAERNGWSEVTAVSSCGPFRRSDVPADSPSALLTSYPQDLLTSPLRASTATIAVGSGGSCTGGPQAGIGGSTTPALRGVDRLTSWFTDFVGRPDLGVGFALAALALSVAFGVVHALAPGHGKTVMAAYLVGQRGTRRQALWLGSTVTLTHTGSVLLLGALISLTTLAAPERVVPVTEVLSGVLLAGLGGYLVLLAVRRLRGLGAADHDHEDEREHDEHHPHGPDHPHENDHDEHHPHGHDHPPGRDHEHPHHDEGHPHHDDHDHPVGAVPAPVLTGATTALAAPPDRVRAAPALAAPPAHSHGGRSHTHAPLPVGKLGWRSLAAMGVAGGLVPSPSALVVLLGANALGRPWFGVLLVLGYGAGMATTLTAAGLLLLRAQAVLARRGWGLGAHSRGARLLPLGTAAVVVVVGLGLVVRGLVTGSSL